MVVWYTSKILLTTDTKFKQIGGKTTPVSIVAKSYQQFANISDKILKAAAAAAAALSAIHQLVKAGNHHCSIFQSIRKLSKCFKCLNC